MPRRNLFVSVSSTDCPAMPPQAIPISCRLCDNTGLFAETGKTGGAINSVQQLDRLRHRRRMRRKLLHLQPTPDEIFHDLEKLHDGRPRLWAMPDILNAGYHK